MAMAVEEAVGAAPRVDDGVEGNSRLTGMVAALLLVVLAAEGATLLDVGQWLSIHVFLGMVVVPLAALKLASTMYRAGRYYLGDGRYRARGAPQWWLRILGPVLAISTVSLLASGIALVLARRHQYPWLGDLHRASFIVWFGVMVIHVLGHLLETGRLAAADFRPSAERVRGGTIRSVVVAASLVIGIALGAATTGWASNFRGQDRGGDRGDEKVIPQRPR
jgi:hypothetical protein